MVNGPGEWCVAYHGTKCNFVKGIVESLLHAGDRGRYGTGIYCSPNVEVAARHGYAKPRSIKVGGAKKRFQYMFMCRVNNGKVCHCARGIENCPNASKPAFTLHIPQSRPDLWFVNQNNDDYQNIRTYGILIREVNGK
jgi:hypothetical protein